MIRVRQLGSESGGGDIYFFSSLHEADVSYAEVGIDLTYAARIYRTDRFLLK